jgi:hypothetical protein
MTDLPDRSSDLSMNPKKYINAGLRTETSEKKKALGGLSDEDIDDSDERPPSPPTKALVHKITYPEKLKRTGSRVNNVSVAFWLWDEVFSLTSPLPSLSLWSLRVMMMTQRTRPVSRSLTL